MELVRKIDFCGFHDLGFMGPTFTWCNLQSGEARVLAWLDRAKLQGNGRICLTTQKVFFFCLRINFEFVLLHGSEAWIWISLIAVWLLLIHNWDELLWDKVVSAFYKYKILRLKLNNWNWIININLYLWINEYSYLYLIILQKVDSLN